MNSGSDDDVFLQNFESPGQSNDILANLCKVEVSPLVRLLKDDYENVMSEEEV